MEKISADIAHERAVVEQRVEIWNQIAEPLNDIYVFNVYLGKWQSLTPKKLINHKRELDTILYSNRPFFSVDFFSAYLEYINATFSTFGGWGEDAKIRASKAHRPNNAERFELINGEDNREEVHRMYYDPPNVVATELKLKIKRPGPVLKDLNGE